MFAEFADLYRALAIVGIAAPVADTMEIWQVASVLGLARPEKAGRGSARPAVKARETVTGQEFLPATPDSVDRIQRRLARAGTSAGASDG